MNYQSKPSIISRSSWGARNSRCTAMIDESNISKLVIHHCATPSGTISNHSEKEQQRYIQNVHMNDNG